MKINLTITVDAWKRVTLSAVFTWPEPAHLLALIEHGPDLWWAKSPAAKTDLTYSAHYHHVRHQHGQRQVIVSCGTTIQDCIIPEGFDPGTPGAVHLEPLLPCTLYAQFPHQLGLILVPKNTTKSLRNRIWRLKSAFQSPDLAPFAKALAQGRSGHFRSVL